MENKEDRNYLLEEEIKKKKFIITGNVYLALSNLFNSYDRLEHLEFYVGVLKGVLATQPAVEIDSIEKIETDLSYERTN